MNARLKHICIVLFSAYLLFLPASAQASSCYGLKDIFYFTCKAGVCQGDFRVREIHGDMGACSRRPVVEEMPQEILPIVLEHIEGTPPNPCRPFSPEELSQNNLVDQFKNIPPDGSFVLQFEHRYYGREPAESANGLKQAFQEELWRKPHFRKFEKLDTNTDLEAIRLDWQKQSNKALVWLGVFWLLNIGSFLLLLWLTYRASKGYQRKFRVLFTSKASYPGIAKYLLAQLALIIPAFFLATDWAINLWLNIFIALLLLVILLFEFFQFCFAALRHGWRLRQKKNGTAQ